MKRLIKTVFLLLLIFGVERFWRLQTGGFKLSKVQTDHHYPFSSTPQKIDPTLLQQRFTYLGSGVQFYAFLGADGTTILKLFKQHHFGPSISLLNKLLPPFLVAPIIEKREKRMLHLLKSAQIAAQLLPNETQLFYTHLQKTEKMFGKTTLIDKMGFSHELNLDKTEFVLQKRCIPAGIYLKNLSNKQEAIDKLLTLIEERSKKGIKNKDGKVLENMGFIDGKAVELDIGSYKMRSKSTHPNPHLKARLKAEKKLMDWIHENSI